VTRPIVWMFVALLLIAAGLGFYAYHLKAKVASEEQRLAQQSQAIVPPASGPTALVTLYVASDQDGGLRRSQINVALPQERSERARAILRALLGAYMQPGRVCRCPSFRSSGGRAHHRIDGHNSECQRSQYH